MKILFIHHGEVPGGAPTSLAYLINELKIQKPKNDYKVWCMNEEMCEFFRKKCSVETSLMPNPLKETGKILIGWTPFFQWGAIKTLWKEHRYIRGRVLDFEKLFISEKPDKIHLNSGCLILPAIAANKCGIPILWHIREVFGGGKWNIRRILIGKWIQRIAQKVFTISDVEKESIEGLQSPKVLTVYNFVDVESFKANKSADEIKKELGFLSGEKYVISLGGAGPRKGLIELINAAKELPAHIKLVVAGPLITFLNKKVKLKARISLLIEDVLVFLKLRPFKFIHYDDRVRLAFESLGEKQNKIHFLGNRTDVANLIVGSEALLFIGTVPHFPRPVYEAWLHKKPVIVSRIKGISTEVEDNKNGIVLKKKSGKDLFHAILELTSNSKLAFDLGENGFQKAMLNFNSKINVQKLLSFF